MNKIVYLICLQFFVISVFARSKYYSFNAGIDAGFSVTTIQKHMPYYGFFENLNYGKRRNGTVGIFVNRFISDIHLLETGFYLTFKGTDYYIGKGKRSSEFFCFDYDYLEIPIVIYKYPKHRSNFSYRYGISLCYLYSGNYMEMYKDFDTILSLGIRFKNKESPILKNCQYVLKFDCSILPITYPDKVEIYNQIQRRDQVLHTNQRNMGITISVQYFFMDFFD